MPFKSPLKMNRDNFIHSFVEHTTNVGFQKANRYLVFIQGPNVQATIDRSIYSDPSIPNVRNLDDVTRDNALAGKFILTNNPAYARPLELDASRRLALNCTSATMSGKSLSTIEIGNIGSGPPSRFPYAETFTNEITLEFNCSLDFFERKYFLTWLNSIVDPNTHDVALYEEYARPFRVLLVMLPPDITDFQKLEKFKQDINSNSSNYVYGDNGVSRSIYYIRLHEVYPVEINESKVDFEDGSIMKIAVKCNYKYWDDPISTYMSNIRFLRENGDQSDPESPFAKFKKIMRDVIRYSDPQALKQDIIEGGLGALGDIIGIENVEQIAQAGQVIDVYSKTPDKDYTVTQRKLLGPLGDILF